MMADQQDLVLERTLDAPVELVWEAYTKAEHMKRWFAPKPYEISEMELDLRPGGIFWLRMTGPDGFDTGHGVPGCILEVVERERLVWTSALGPGFRPNVAGEGCEALPFTAVITFADGGNGRTRYKAVALHKDAQDCATHEKMGFTEGWGTVADQLADFARSLAVGA
jgi:uncharacterized protein YndB with AHSA1/START domain